jgi:hypothetical protein
MIYVDIQGQVKQRDQVAHFCRSVLRDLMPRLRRDVDLTVSFVQRCDCEEAGFCVGDRDEVEITVAKTSQGEAYSLSEQLVSLCHELVHAKQFLSGELENPMIWKGVDMSLLPLSQHPWETEAFDKEQSLFEKHKHLLIH